MGGVLLLTKGKLTCCNSRIFAQTNSVIELARMSDISAEASTRASADTNLQNQINAHTSQIASLSANSCEIYTGTYIGNGAATQDIVLGFRPKAVLIMYMGFLLENGICVDYKRPLGGIGTPNWSTAGITLTSTGFRVQYTQTGNPQADIDGIFLNTADGTYIYLAFK